MYSKFALRRPQTLLFNGYTIQLCIKMLVNEYLKTIKGIEKETCTFLFVNVNVKVFHMYFYLHKRFEYLE